MNIARCYSAHLAGLTLEVIAIEVDISNGLNAVSVVGLGDRAVEEAKDRVSAAIKNSGFVSPKQKNQKVIISLAPAHLRKEGPSFDLAIAIAYLQASRDLDASTKSTLFLGELSLEGGVRPVRGVLPILCQAKNHGFKRAFIPALNQVEASLASGISIIGVSTLSEAILILKGELTPKAIPNLRLSTCPSEPVGSDMDVIRGNEGAKRGLEVAAAGAHNALLFGPPGTGKTMLAQSFSTILPPLTEQEAIEVTGIHSVAHTLKDGFIRTAPFRAPHHTASYPAIVGGGAFPRPGEITLAHKGVLFLDEFPEFDRSVLEALRQPLEERKISVSRARGSVTFPAQCILIASMNPCPCGKPREKGCLCREYEIRSYRRRVSGPIMDRLDLWINVNKIDYEKMSSRSVVAESSATIRARVTAARRIQSERFARFGKNKSTNSEMDAGDIEKCIEMSESSRKILRRAGEQLSLSGRAFHRIIKVARTIADLSAEESISDGHILEALMYRQSMDEPIICKSQSSKMDSLHHESPSEDVGP